MLDLCLPSPVVLLLLQHLSYRNTDVISSSREERTGAGGKRGVAIVGRGEREGSWGSRIRRSRRRRRCRKE